MEKQVILDDKSFKALSADSRINILKQLNERRMTLSELSQKLSLKNSTVKEHCLILLNAQLISKIDEGRKWKYYELTQKGKQVVEPNLMQEAKVFVLLSLTTIMFMGIILFLFQNMIIENTIIDLNYSSVGQDISIMQIQTNETDDFRAEVFEESATLSGINYNIFSISIITVLVIGLFIGWVVGRRTN